MQCFIPLPDAKSQLLPDAFTNPFDYNAHPLCLVAKAQLEQYLPPPMTMTKGKMYGLLVVKTNTGDVGFLAACSGNESDNNKGIHFVPQVFDLTNPNGFFRKEETQLNKINQQIKQLSASEGLISLKLQYETLKKEANQKLANAKTKLQKAKAERAQKRASTSDQPTLNALIKESQTQKSNFTRLKKKLKEEQQQIEEALAAYHDEIERLKRLRKQQSGLVQKQLFDSYVFYNIKGEQRSATEIFKHTDARVPPAGAGDCAAPKLLQYAFLNQLTPIVMAEFWWGPSPLNAIRKHNYFYPACKNKCEPILGFMLQGLTTERAANTQTSTISVIYEDEALAVINKPAGLLSVPGKEVEESVLTQAKSLFPEATGPMIVHRLDMATSGLMLIAKSKDVHEHLQKQFLSHSIHKQYAAILDGRIEANEGEINLPLRVDLNDRPRQLVCFDHGKPALTKWQIMNRQNGRTKVYFNPVTGRTHQLRVHAAHHLGLNTPIVGDPLYGKKANRLMLHARKIEFVHPVSEKRLSFTFSEEEQGDWNGI